MARDRELSERMSAEAYRQLAKPRRNKHGNVPVAGFDSKHEARWAEQLLWREQQGEIMGLCLDKRLLRYPLVVGQTYICEYEADARWIECKTGEVIVADAKSPDTRKNRDYVIKIKLMVGCWGIYIREL